MERVRECQNLVRERQLCSGNVASASSPGVPRHILAYLGSWWKRGQESTQEEHLHLNLYFLSKSRCL